MTEKVAAGWAGATYILLEYVSVTRLAFPSFLLPFLSSSLPPSLFLFPSPSLPATPKVWLGQVSKVLDTLAYQLSDTEL